MLNLAKHRTSFFFVVLLFLFCGTAVAIMIAKGYKIDLIKKQIVPNGILVADSNPIGALVFVDGKLKTATNNTVSLPPGKYNIEIKKDGFYSWKKEILIQKELVAFADAFLFSEVPDIKPITLNGAVNPVISPDKSRIVYTVLSSSTDAGLWVLDITDSILFFSRSPKLIAKNSLNFDLSKANYYWSPDGRQIVLEANTSTIYLLNPDVLNNFSLTSNVFSQFGKITAGWQAEEDIKTQSRMKKVPVEMREILKNSAGNLNFSPDNSKIMYVATASAEIPQNLIPQIFSASTQKENRKIEPNKLYVYDIKEDKNFEISNFKVSAPTPTIRKQKSAKSTPTPVSLTTQNSQPTTPAWFPTSHHLVWVTDDNKIVACEYDGTNLTTVYSGQFVSPFAFVTPNSGKLIILAELDFTLEKQTSPTPTPVKKIKTTPTPAQPQTNLFSVSLR